MKKIDIVFSNITPVREGNLPGGKREKKEVRNPKRIGVLTKHRWIRGGGGGKQGDAPTSSK